MTQRYRTLGIMRRSLETPLALFSCGGGSNENSSDDACTDCACFRITVKILRIGETFETER